MLHHWKNIYLIALLAFLQCFAPLLHAHTLGMQHTNGVHVHFDHDLLEVDEAEAGKPSLQIAKTELPAIGMVQEYKKDYVFSVSSDQGVVSAGLPASFLNVSTVVVAGSLGQPSLRFYHPLPFPQAPPAFSVLSYS